MENSALGLTSDDFFDALAHVQRRKLLLALLEHNPQDDTPVVVNDCESEFDALDDLVNMYHVHLPKLADYGLVDWDEDGHEVTKGRNFDEIRPLLELLAEHGDELPDDWL